jgi:hypothetical protein
MLKVGDRVEYIGCANHVKGQQGIVLNDPEYPDSPWVEFDNNLSSSNDAYGRGKMNHCYRCPVKDLKLVTPLTPFEQQVNDYIRSELHNA